MSSPSRSAVDRAFDLILPSIVLLHLISAPYTKVEESFNIQATHDILTYGIPFAHCSYDDWVENFELNAQSWKSGAFLRCFKPSPVLASSFDHVDFPGSVPRTFVGSLILAGLSKPFTFFELSEPTLQLLIRGILGLAVAGSLVHVRSAVDLAYGRVSGRWYVLFQASQFHTMFYASRTLPNMFAFVLTNVALRNFILAKNGSGTWITHKASKRRMLAIYLLTAAAVMFRSEIAILLITETGYLVWQGHVELVSEVIPSAYGGFLVGIICTVFIDSFFWREFPLWPEWSGFYYNTILGQSSNWGTEPFYFYFLNALPRLLLNPMTYLVLIPLSLNLPTSKDILAPQAAFIAIYSLLPHKEWRFIIYTIPAFTVVAAGAAGWIWNRRDKAPTYRTYSILLMASTLGTFLISLVSLYISTLNYPGAEALSRLHTIAGNSAEMPVRVHMDNLACQTGVSRFQQLHPLWTYDKTENETLLLSPLFWQGFDYVLAEDPKRIIGSWEPVETISGFSGVTLRPGKEDDVLPMPKILGTTVVHDVYQSISLFARKFTMGYWPAVKMEPRIWILRKLPAPAERAG